MSQESIFCRHADGIAPSILAGEVYSFGRADRGFTVYADGEEVGEAVKYRSEGSSDYWFTWREPGTALHGLTVAAATKPQLLKALRDELQQHYQPRTSEP